MGKITIKNVSTATVYVVSDKFRRELAPGRVVPINRAIYDDLMFDPGFNNLVAGHYIKIDGIEEEEAVSENESNIYDVDSIAAMYNNKDYVGFAKFIPTATMAEKDTVVQLAVNMGITDNGFTALIKKYCNVDVISAINRKHEAEER